MTPERMAELVARWAGFYTRDLPIPIAQRRVDEVEADLHDHIAHERANGISDRRIAPRTRGGEGLALVRLRPHRSGHRRPPAADAGACLRTVLS
jgi:hypothetical protein